MPLSTVVEAVGRSNNNVGGNVVEQAGQWAVVRGIGLIESTADVENIVIGSSNGTPIYVRNVANVKLGNSFRTGSLDKDGKEVVGGVVIARAEGRFDASLTAGYRRSNMSFPVNGISETGEQKPVQSVFNYWTFIVTIQLPVRNKNQGAIEAAVSNAEAARAYRRMLIPNAYIAGKSLTLTRDSMPLLARHRCAWSWQTPDRN